MKRKECFKRWLMLAGVASFGLAVMTSPVATISAQAAPGDPGISTMSVNEDRIEWVLQNFNGLIYRRLFNYTVSEWIGEWEYIGTYEEIFGPRP